MGDFYNDLRIMKRNLSPLLKQKEFPKSNLREFYYCSFATSVMAVTKLAMSEFQME